jgi:cytochrome P450
MELDTTIGRGQLPTLDDESSLPYFSAVVKESLRWMVVSPMALPHILTKDDEYKGFTFPAGSIMIPNSWYVYTINLSGNSIHLSTQGNPSR